MARALFEYRPPLDQPSGEAAAMRRLVEAINSAVDDVPIEYQPTLDDLFGPDIDAEMRESASTIRRLSNGAHLDLESYRSEVSRFVRLADLARERHELSRYRFWQTFFIGPAVGLDGEPSGWPPRIKVYLFPSLGCWLVGVKWGLQDSIRDGQEAIRRALDELRRLAGRVARFVGKAARRSIEAALDAMDRVRRPGPIAALRSAVGTLRELIGELLSPSIQAAGGGPGLFILRI